MGDIKYYRKRKRLSQTELGEMVGMSRFSIAAYENGEKSPTVGTLEKIASVLDAPFSELLAGLFENERAEDLKGDLAKEGRNLKMIEAVFGELLRFCVLTDDEAQKKKLASLIKEKKLSREDLILILETIGLNPDFKGGENVSLEKRIRKLEIEVAYLKACNQTRITMENNGGVSMLLARERAEREAKLNEIDDVFPQPSIENPVKCFC